MPKSRPKSTPACSTSTASNTYSVPQPKTCCLISFRTSKGEQDENPATVATYNVEMRFERKAEGPWKFELLHGKANKGCYLIVRPSFDKDENVYRDALHIQGEKWNPTNKYTTMADGLVIHRVVFWKLTSQVGPFRLLASCDGEIAVSETFSVGSRRPGSAALLEMASSDVEDAVVEEEDTEQDVVPDTTPVKRKRSRPGKSSWKRSRSDTTNSPETTAAQDSNQGDDGAHNSPDASHTFAQIEAPRKVVEVPTIDGEMSPDQTNEQIGKIAQNYWNATPINGNIRINPSNSNNFTQPHATSCNALFPDAYGLNLQHFMSNFAAGDLCTDYHPTPSQNNYNTSFLDRLIPNAPPINIKRDSYEPLGCFIDVSNSSQTVFLAPQQQPQLLPDVLQQQLQPQPQSQHHQQLQQLLFQSLHPIQYQDQPLAPLEDE